MIYNATPVQEISKHPSLEKAGVRVLVKREDLNHPELSGNKWWKLKYNLAEASSQNHQTILTFGGAYSNHIYATAAAAAEAGFESIGIIRGEETLPLNRTLQFALEKGMRLNYITREYYRRKNDPEFIEGLRRKYGLFYLIPEGGTNLLAVKGCAEFAEKELAPISFDHLCMAVGTGGTMAGVVCGLKDGRNIIGVPVLKGGEFLKQEIKRMVQEFCGSQYERWSLLLSYHHGGYAKSDPALHAFINEMQAFYQLQLDPVYTAKLLWAIIKEVEMGAFRRGDTILALHSGGLQGARQYVASS